MLRIITIILFLCMTSLSFAQTGSSKTQSGLNAEINTLWPDNTSGQITPFNARQTLLDMVATQFAGPLNCGAIDDTVLVQSQMDVAGVVVLPPVGTCVVSNLIATRNVRISGSGPASVLQFKSGSTGYMLDSTTSFYIQIQNMQLNGGNVTNYNSTSSPGTRSGVHLWANVDNSSIIGSVVTGFNNVAIGLNGDTNANKIGTIIEANNISYNYCAIDTGPSGAAHDTCTGGANGAEYLKIANNGILLNRYGIVVDSGNVDMVDNNIYSNGYCLWIAGSPAPNPGHGTFTGNLCNHSLVEGLHISAGMSNGFTISSNQFFDGDWTLNAPDGITISGNTLDITNLNLVGGAGYINFANNWFLANTTITDTSSNTHWNNNWNSVTQDFINNSTALLVDPKGVAVSSSSAATGSNLVTDGTFTSDPGPWTKGAGWTINTGTNSADSAGNAFSFLNQNISSAAFSYYQVTFTLANYVSGVLVVGVGGSIDNFSYFANGTYTTVMPTGSNFDGNLYFVSSSFVGSIQNVSVKKWTTTSTISLAQTLTIPTTVASLVTCNSANKGARAFVTDQNTAVSYRGAVTGGGSTNQAVVCDGTNWLQD